MKANNKLKKNLSHFAIADDETCMLQIKKKGNFSRGSKLICESCENNRHLSSAILIVEQSVVYYYSHCDLFILS